MENETPDRQQSIADLVVKYANEYVTDKEREILRNAGYTFDTISTPFVRVTDIYKNGRRVAKVIDGKVKWY